MIKKGDKLRCLNADGYVFLTEGKVYTALKDEEPGIFDTNYVMVSSDHEAHTITCHVTRFAPATQELFR